ncbi:MAG: secretory subunit [Chaenotheca gracillima]|nr:MAG: secretory subunit [Chaenotheca gracillima]
MATQVLAQQVAEPARKTGKPITNSSISKLLEGETVKIEVSPSKRCWHLHKNALCHNSLFFAAALEGDFKEGLEKAIHLPEDNEYAFKLFVLWLYKGNIEEPADTTKLEMWNHAWSFFELYVLADKLMIAELKNLAIDLFRHTCLRSHQGPGAIHMKAIYQRTMRGSPFRRLVVQSAARSFMSPDATTGASKWSTVMAADPDFAVDFADHIREQMGRKVLPYAFKKNDCLFHEHLDGEACAEPS